MTTAAEYRCKNPSSVYSYAVSLGYPYLRGEGRTAQDGRTWLSRVTKKSDGSGSAIFVGWDAIKRKWIIEQESGADYESGPRIGRGGNPHMQVSFDPAVKKFLAYMHDEKFGNLYATGYTKKQAAQALREVWRKARATGSWRNPFDWREQRQRTASSSPLYDSIRHGDKVTIVNRFGQSRSGKAVMLGPAGWVLNMGGAHGTPAIATPENVTKVRASNPEKKPKPRRGESAPDYHARRVREILAKMPKPIRDVFDRNPATYKFVFRNPSLFVGNRITISEGSGIDSGKSGVIIPWKGSRDAFSYKAESRMTNLWVRLDDGTERIVPKNRLIRANPDDGELEQAEELFEEFHGKEPREILEMQESSEMRGDYAALGDLIELTMIAPNGDHVLIKFKNDGVRVASSAEGSQLYLLGGNQDISGNLAMFGADESKDLIDLGEAKQIVYEDAKWQTNFVPQEWKHDFGEESGVRPRGFYDQLKQRVFFTGGNYQVKRPGIVD